VAGGILALELAIALGIADPRFSKLLLLVLGAGGLILVLSFPFAATCLLLALVGSINFPAVAFPVGPIDAQPHELLLGALLLVALVKPARPTFGGLAGGALIAFLGLLSLTTLLAVADGAVPLSGALPWIRPFFVYALVIVIVRLFPDRESLRRLLAVAAALAAFSGLVAGLLAIGSGAGAALNFSEGLLTQTGSDGTQRVRLPGVGLAYGLFWLVVVQVVRTSGRERALWTLALAGIMLNIAASQNRNMWVGLVIGCLLMLTFGGAQIRHRVVIGTCVLAAGVTLMLTFGFRVDEDSRFAPILERGTTLFDPAAVGQERSLTHRAEENQLAWEAASANPLVGIGAGTNFGQSFGEKRPDGTTHSTNQNFLHNQYLYLLMIGGVPVLATFLVFLGAVLAPVARRPDPTMIPCAVGLVMIMVSAVVMLSFSSLEMVAAIALLAGVMVAWHRGEALAPRH